LITDSLFEGNESPYNGISLFNSQYAVERCTFQNNYSAVGSSVFFCQEVCMLSVKESKFINDDEEKRYLFQKYHLSIFRVNLLENLNYAESEGTFIFGTLGSNLVIESSTFEKGVAGSGGAISLKSKILIAPFLIRKLRSNC
jgi:hypothetical protein